jgi:hypothetical protein
MIPCLITLWAASAACTIAVLKLRRRIKWLELTQCTAALEQISLRVLDAEEKTKKILTLFKGTIIEVWTGSGAGNVRDAAEASRDRPVGGVHAAAGIVRHRDPGWSQNPMG